MNRADNMESTSLPSLLDDSKHYAKSFQVFAAKSAKFSEYADWGDGVFSEEVVAKLRPGLVDGGEELRLLGMGSGSGEKDCIMLEKLLQRFPRINNRVVEPDQEMLARYKTLAQSRTRELHGVHFDWRQQTIEQHEKEGDLTKFHFISSVHSIYHVGDVDRTLMYLYNSLQAGGILLLIITSDDSGWRRFRDRFCCLNGVRHCHINSAGVRDSLTRQNIAYNQYHHPTFLDITTCFDESSEEGRLIVDFITHVLKFKETAPADLQREVMEYLASSDCSEKSGNGTLFKIDWDAIVIRKPFESN